MTDQEMLEAIRLIVKEVVKEEIEPVKDYERGTRVLIESKIEFQIRAVAEQHGELVKEIKALGQRREVSDEVKSRVLLLEEVSRNLVDRVEALEAKAQ